MAREHKVSIEESAQPELLNRASELGLLRQDCYTQTRTAINHANGTHFFFIGLSVVSEEDIRGLSMVDLVWVEEAHRISRTSWEMVYPTIRKDNAEIWMTFNPKYRTDIAWELAQRTNDPTYWIKKINYPDNMFFTPRNNRDRLRDKIENPDRYGHIWEGEPDDASAAKKVLPYAMLRLCVDAWEKRPTRGALVHGGYDVADTGDDKNALAIRCGPELFHVERWRGSMNFTVSDSTRRACLRCAENNAVRLVYDAGGVGAGVRGPFLEWLQETGHRIAPTPFNFGGEVRGKDINFITGTRPMPNGRYFSNAGSQSGMVLRMRAENTRRLLNGDDINPDNCLFINPDIPDIEEVLSQMGQPEWDDKTGKYKIDKKPKHPGEPEPPSPDSYDAVAMAFSEDARRGLQQR